MTINWRFYLVISAIILAFVAGCGKDPFGSDVEDLLPLSQIRPMEDDMFNLLNSDRADYGFGALSHNNELREVARNHSEDMFLRDYLDHTNPDGETPSDRAENAGISFSAIAENIHTNSGQTSPVEFAQTAFMDSSPHRANILSTAFDVVGIGIASDGDKYYFTQVFARLSSPARLYFSTFVLEPFAPAWPNWEGTFEEAWNR